MLHKPTVCRHTTDGLSPASPRQENVAGRDNFSNGPPAPAFSHLRPAGCINTTQTAENITGRPTLNSDSNLGTDHPLIKSSDSYLKQMSNAKEFSGYDFTFG